MPVLSPAKEETQTWELINPEGIVAFESVKIATNLDTLEGKTVGLRWNGKPNGDLFLNRIADLLMEKVRDIKVIKAYEVAPETATISHGHEKAKEIAKKLVSLNPDIVIGSTAD